MPYYASCADEVNLVLEKEGSFIKDRLEAFKLDWDSSGADLDHKVPNGALEDDQTITSSGQGVTNTIRAVTESVLEFHFEKEIMDELYQKYAELLSKYLSNSTTMPKTTVFVISLVKKN